MISEASGQHGGGGDTRIDLRSHSLGAVLFLNNIEKDREYRQFPRSVRVMLQPSYQLHMVRKNM